MKNYNFKKKKAASNEYKLVNRERFIYINNMEFGKSLQEKLGEHEPHEVDELILDDLYQNIGNFTNEHKKTLESYKNLIHLSLNGLGLKSLANFPKLLSLQIVILLF